MAFAENKAVAVLAGAAALGLTACNDSDDTPPGEDPVVVPPPEAIGTYSFDGTKAKDYLSL